MLAVGGDGRPPQPPNSGGSRSGRFAGICSLRRGWAAIWLANEGDEEAALRREWGAWAAAGGLPGPANAEAAGVVRRSLRVGGIGATGREAALRWEATDWSAGAEPGSDLGERVADGRAR